MVHQVNKTLGPSYQLRVEDLRGAETIVARCLCRHEAVLDPDFLKRFRPLEFVRNIEKKLTCTDCGLRGMSRFIVFWTEEEPTTR